jgi:hypothetical protein
MVQGLMIGLGAFGTSLATRGQKGGVEEVAQIQGQQQEQKIQAQQAAQAAKNAKLQQDLQVFQTNQQLMENVLHLATLSDQITEAHTKAQEGKVGLIGATQDVRAKALPDLISTGDKAAYDQTLQQLGTPSGTSTPGTPAASSEIPPAAVSQWKKSIDAASSAYPNDPDIKDAQQKFQDAQKSGDSQALALASRVASNRMESLKTGTELRLAATNADKAVSDTAVAKIKADQDQLAMNTYKASGSKEDFATWQAGATKAAETAVTQGDPSTMGAMAADGLLTIPQIALARQLDKAGFQKLLQGADDEAKRLGMPEIVVNGKGTGHYFNSNAATQQYQYVQEFNNPNSKVQQSIASGNTFINHAADLRDVVSDFKTTGSPFLNTPLNKIRGQVGGDTAITRLTAALNPVKTEYQNALAAGFSPSAEDQEAAATIMNTSSTPAMIDVATQQMAHTLLRRMVSTDQGYVAHTGVHYPNMITPDAKGSLAKLGLDSGDMQSGGSFSGTPQVVNAGKTGTTPTVAPEGHQVNLAGGGTATKKGGQWVNDQTGQPVK